MGAIVQWKNTSIYNGIRIHGTKDKVLPQKGKPDFSILGAGHFVVITHGEKVSNFIHSSLKES